MEVCIPMPTNYYYILEILDCFESTRLLKQNSSKNKLDYLETYNNGLDYF